MKSNENQLYQLLKSHYNISIYLPCNYCLSTYCGFCIPFSIEDSSVKVTNQCGLTLGVARKVNGTQTEDQELSWNLAYDKGGISSGGGMARGGRAEMEESVNGLWGKNPYIRKLSLSITLH